MPPIVGQNETREQATVRWLTQILAAVVHESDGHLLISRTAIAADHKGLDLLESRDCAGNIVLRFEEVRNLAIYPLNGGARWDGNQREVSKQETTSVPSSGPAPSPSQQELFADMLPSSQTTNGVAPPKTQAQIRELERVLAKQKMVNRIVAAKLNQEQKKRASLEGLLESAELFNSGR